MVVASGGTSISGCRVPPLYLSLAYERTFLPLTNNKESLYQKKPSIASQLSDTPASVTLSLGHLFTWWWWWWVVAVFVPVCCCLTGERIRNQAPEAINHHYLRRHQLTSSSSRSLLLLLIMSGCQVLKNT